MAFRRSSRFRHMLGLVTALVVTAVGVMPACVCALNAAPGQPQTTLPCHEAAPVSAPSHCPTDGIPCEVACSPTPRSWATKDTAIIQTVVRAQIHPEHGKHLVASIVAPTQATHSAAHIGHMSGDRASPADFLRVLSATLLRV